MRNKRARRGPIVQGSRGFILAIGLIFLLVLTMISIAMFRSVALQESIAGSTRDKQRSFEAAQSALQYGQWWLTQGSFPVPSACSGVATALRVCSSQLADPLTLPWTTRTDYVPPYMTVASGGGLATGGDINYQTKPGVYISDQGTASDGSGEYYQVTAVGYGGNANTVSVVQSTYKLVFGGAPSGPVGPTPGIAVDRGGP